MDIYFVISLEYVISNQMHTTDTGALTFPSNQPYTFLSLLEAMNLNSSS